MADFRFERGDFMASIILGFLLFYAITFAWCFLKSILSVVIGKLYGGELGSFNFLWFSYRKENNGYVWSRKKFSMLSNATMAGEQFAENPKQKLKWEGTVIGILSLICVIGAIGFFTHGELISPMGFAGSLCVVLAVATLGEWLVHVYWQFGNSTKAICARETQECLRQIMAGRRPRDITVPLKESIWLSTNSGIEMRHYVLYQYYRALDKRDRQGMRDAIRCIERGLRLENPLSFLSGFFAECVFYYSFVEKNVTKAEQYYKISPIKPEQDKDLNGRRIYAYYLYYIKEDREAALKAIEEGFAVAADFPGKGHIIMEKELLEFLRNKIWNDREMPGTTKIKSFFEEGSFDSGINRFC